MSTVGGVNTGREQGGLSPGCGQCDSSGELHPVSADHVADSPFACVYQHLMLTAACCACWLLLQVGCQQFMLAVVLLCAAASGKQLQALFACRGALQQLLASPGEGGGCVYMVSGSGGSGRTWNASLCSDAVLTWMLTSAARNAAGCSSAPTWPPSPSQTVL
jgi:hypothetical protein